MCSCTFAFHYVDKVCAVAVTDELLLHTETSDVYDFLHVGQVLVFVVHPPADGALALETDTICMTKKREKTTNSLS